MMILYYCVGIRQAAAAAAAEVVRIWVFYYRGPHTVPESSLDGRGIEPEAGNGQGGGLH